MFNTYEGEIYRKPKTIKDIELPSVSLSHAPKTHIEPKLNKSIFETEKLMTPSLPKKTSMRLGGLMDIQERMKSRKSETKDLVSKNYVNEKKNVEDSMNVLTNL